MRALLVNTHSILNTGDMGIVQAQIRLIKDFCSDAVISLTSRTPHQDKDFTTAKKLKCCLHYLSHRVFIMPGKRKSSNV